MELRGGVGVGVGFCCFKSYLETPEWAGILRPCFPVIAQEMRPAGLREPEQLEVISSHPKSTEMGGGKLEKDAFSGKNVARKCKLEEENVSFALGTLNGNFVIVNMLLPSSGTWLHYWSAGNLWLGPHWLESMPRPQS